MAGLSLIELMIAMALGLIVLGALATLFANSSRARTELERDSRQIENGRFAMELLTEDLRLAGYMGEIDMSPYVPPSGVSPNPLPDACDLNPATWIAAFPLHVQAYDNGAAAPACPFSALKPNTDIIVIRRAAGCEAGIAGCPAAVGGQAYLQAARCQTEVADPLTAYRIGVLGGTPFTARMRDCGAVAPLRRYMVHIYYISNDNGYGIAIPTLKRLELAGNRFVDVPLVEGIEELNFEYGLDSAPPHSGRDGRIDGYSSAPAAGDWPDVISVRINLLARNIESSPGYTDTKTYNLGRDAANNPIIITPGGDVRRHAYSGLVRIVNAAHRRENP